MKKTAAQILENLKSLESLRESVGLDSAQGEKITDGCDQVSALMAKLRPAVVSLRSAVAHTLSPRAAQAFDQDLKSVDFFKLATEYSEDVEQDLFANLQMAVDEGLQDRIEDQSEYKGYVIDLYSQQNSDYDARYDYFAVVRREDKGKALFMSKTVEKDSEAKKLAHAWCDGHPMHESITVSIGDESLLRSKGFKKEDEDGVRSWMKKIDSRHEFLIQYDQSGHTDTIAVMVYDSHDQDRLADAQAKSISQAVGMLAHLLKEAGLSGQA